jgi:hypothetical protein
MISIRILSGRARESTIKIFLLLCALLPAGPVVASNAPRIASYEMNVQLFPEERVIRGHEILTWINPAPDPTDELWFHLYLNAFKNEKSTFIVESKGKHRGETIELGEWGSIDVDSIRIVGGQDLLPTMEYMRPDDGNEEDQTVMRVRLPRDVAPGDSVSLRIVFRSRLHQVFARSGFRRDFFMAAQWFPKIGVFEGGEMGWNCHQYHAHSEYYADFGTYDVRITTPDPFVVGATGEMMDAVENEDGTTTYHYYQEDVHDFAWTASPDYIRLERDFIAVDRVSSSRIDSLADLFQLDPEEVALNDVRMILLIQPTHLDQVDRHFEALSNAILSFGTWYGPYPYRTITFYDPPRGASDAGGMEYPTIFGAGTSWIAPGDRLSPEGVIVHEFGHQYWYGLVASNEFEEPWLDEGFTTYSTEKVLDTAYGPNRAYKRFGGEEGIPYPGFDWLNIDTQTETFGKITFPLVGIYFEDVPIGAFEGRKKSYLSGPRLDRLNKNAWSFYDDDSYWINAYSRPALMLKTVENILGNECMARVMRRYHGEFRYRHPTTEDFIRIVNEVSGNDMENFLRQALEENTILDYSVDRVESDTVRIKAGMYDTPEGRIELEEEEEEYEKRPFVLTEEGLPLIESEVWVRRRGEFRHPVDLLVIFEDGEVVTERWNGISEWKKYRYLRTARIKSAEIDPLHEILLDVNRSNNSRTLEENRIPVLRWSSRWLLWMQNLLHLASTFG